MSRPQMSEELNRVLDGYGLSRTFTEYRRLVMNYFSVCFINIRDDSFSMGLVVGSKRDALCSHWDTESDFDVLCILPAMTINSGNIKASKSLLSTKTNFKDTEFLLENGPFPGYKYLKCLGSVQNKVLCTKTFSGCQYLRNYPSLFSTTDSKSQFEIHGPALNIVTTLRLSNNKTIPVNNDIVPGIYCRILPADYDEWCNRTRNHNWPPPWIIEATEKQGCLLVGVGHPASDTPDIEWRLSLSKTELLLTKSFNHVQMKCYVMMKLVLKRIIQPQMKDPLSSYHVKTVMFWMSEEREEHFWRPDNLAECLISSFKKLKTCVENKNCPNYFLTDVNLLDGKLEEDIHHKVIDILDSIITEGPMVVYRCLPLNPSLNELRCEHYTHTSSDCLYQHLLKDRLKEINSINPEFAQSLRSIVETDDIYHHCQFGLVDWYLVNELRNRSGIFSHAFSVLSVLKEIEIPNEKEVYSLEMRLISMLLKDEHVARIKLATYLYYRRCLDCCIPLLWQAIKSMESSREFEVCTQEQAYARDGVEIDGVDCIYLTQNKKGFRVSEIVFSPCDERLVPPYIQDEMGQPKTVNGTYYEGWVFVDSIVYAYYLLIVTLHDMRKYSLMTLLSKRFGNVCTQQPGTIRIFRKDMTKRLYGHAYRLVMCAKRDTKL